MTAERLRARLALIDRIKLGKTAAGDTVFANRTLPLKVSRLPGIYLQMRKEDSELYTSGSPRLYKRTLRVDVECLAAAEDDKADNLVDLMAEDVEALIEMDPTLAGTVEDCRIVGETRIGIDEEGSVAVAAAIVPIELEYLKEAVQCDPDELPHFASLSVVYNTTGQMPPAAPGLLPPTS